MGWNQQLVKFDLKYSRILSSNFKGLQIVAGWGPRFQVEVQVSDIRQPAYTQQALHGWLEDALPFRNIASFQVLFAHVFQGGYDKGILQKSLQINFNPPQKSSCFTGFKKKPTKWNFGNKKSSWFPSPGLSKERLAALPRSRRRRGSHQSTLASPLLMFIVLGQISWWAVSTNWENPKFSRLVVREIPQKKIALIIHSGSFGYIRV